MKKLFIFIALLICGKIFSQVKGSSKSEKYDTTYDGIFPGGGYGFRQEFYQSFDMDKVKGNGIIASEVLFVVTSEGKVTNIKATGTNISMNNEMERTIKKLHRFKWIPPKIDGKPIDSTYRFPVVLTVDGE